MLEMPGWGVPGRVQSDREVPVVFDLPGLGKS